MAPLLRSALRFPVRPADSLRDLAASGAALRFALVFAVMISVFAGLRAGLMTDVDLFSPQRFASSLFGFVLLPAVALYGGRALGGRAAGAVVAAVFVGSALPFLLVDGLWSLYFAAGGAAPAGETAPFWWRVAYLVLWPFERLTWLWAAVVLVVGLAEAQRFSRWRALASLGMVALALAVLVGGLVAFRAATT